MFPALLFANSRVKVVRHGKSNLDCGKAPVADLGRWFNPELTTASWAAEGGENQPRTRISTKA